MRMALFCYEIPAISEPRAVLLDGQRAGGGGHDTGGILLREHNATDRHRLGSDGTGGHRTVLHSFRTCTILRPLGGSQATFADKNRFRLQRGRRLRNKPFLYTDERLSGGIVARGSGEYCTHHPPEIPHPTLPRGVLHRLAMGMSPVLRALNAARLRLAN